MTFHVYLQHSKMFNIANILIFSENTAFSLKKKNIYGIFLENKKKKKKYFRMLLALSENTAFSLKKKNIYIYGIFLENKKKIL